MTASDFYSSPVEEQARRLTLLAEKSLALWGHQWKNPKLLKHRENAVFSVENDMGDRAALRVHRYNYHSDAELLAELQWMKAVREAGLVVPDVVPSLDQSLYVHVSHDLVPEPRQVDLLTWLDGSQLGAIEESASGDANELVGIYLELGRLAGRLHNHSESWALPDGFTRHAWDRDGLIGPEPFWGRFWELPALSPDQVVLLKRASARADVALAELGKDKSVYGMIHADMVPENVLVNNGAPALIDFDDAGFGWYMFELATALFFQMDHPAYAELCDALIRGYEELRPGSVNRDLLPLFLFLRSTTYLGWVYTRSETETAKELTPYLVEAACRRAEEYLATT